MKIFSGLCVVILCAVSFLAGTIVPVHTYAQQKEEDPKLTLEQHDKIMSWETQDLQLFIRIQSISKKYDDMMKADPDYVAATTLKAQVEKELGTYVAEINKTLDPKKWQVDLNRAAIVKVEPAPEPPKKP